MAENQNLTSQPTPDANAHPLDGESFGAREFGDMDEMHVAAQDHLFTTAEQLLSSDTTHVGIEIPRPDGSKTTLVDEENQPLSLRVKRSKEGKPHIIRDHKAAWALSALGVGAIAAAWIVPKVRKK